VQLCHPTPLPESRPSGSVGSSLWLTPVSRRYEDSDVSDEGDEDEEEEEEEEDEEEGI
jgi:hypothetical protein